VRVLLVSANFRPHVGGVERYTEILAGGLARNGHDVTVLCCGYGSASEREEIDGFRVVRVRASYILETRAGVPYPLPSPSFVRTLRALVAVSDVVNVQDALYLTSRVALSVSHRRGVATVLTQHVSFVPQQRRWLDTVQRAAIATIGRGAGLATAVVTYNPAVADWAEQTWGIARPLVVPAGVDPTSPNLDRDELLRSFGLPTDRFLALFVGRDVPKKGLAILLAAADPAYEIVAVTDREGAGSSVTILPFMSPRRLGELMCCVDAFVLPSEGEGFPLSLQEAFTAGLPVVTTMQPGYEHYITGDEVIVVDRDPASVRDALVRLTESEALRRRLSERSLAVAERHFSLDRFVSAYEGVYEDARRHVNRSL